MNGAKVTIEDLLERKKRREAIAALTVYDYPMTRLLDEMGVPILLVGDSLGMVVLGYPDTTHVTMDEMTHHVRAASRANPRGLLVADLPYQSYRTPAEAVVNARRLMDAGADGVKAEGGREILDQVRAVLEDGIPFMGHLGMLPQHILEEGRYRVKGKAAEEQRAMLEDARALASLGVMAIVLELVTPPVAKEITLAIDVPTIGIGSGPDCDGQILVTHDLIGSFPWFTPKFVQPRARVSETIRQAVRDWMQAMPAPPAASASKPT